MKRMLIFYGLYEHWNKTKNHWDKNLYDKENLMKHIGDLIDGIAIFNDIPALKKYLKNYILPVMTWHITEILDQKIPSLFVLQSNFIKILDDKAIFFEYAKAHRLEQHLPLHYDIHSERNSDTLVLVKPRCGASSAGIYKKKLRDICDEDFKDCIVENYTYGNEEYDAVIVSDKGNITCSFAYACSFDKPEHIKMQEGNKIVSYKRVELDDNVKCVLEQFLKPCQYTGTCCIDYKLCDGKVFIFEINPRLNGALASPWNKSDLALVIRNLIYIQDAR